MNEGNPAISLSQADWSERLVFGIARVDVQHKQLFDLAATFEGNYVKIHLIEEELLLERCGYPKLAEHKELHKHFKTLLQQLLAEANGMTLDQIAGRVHYLINGWFYNHILIADLDYVPLVKEHPENQLLE